MASGVQPIGLYQWLFEYLWLYGLVEPKTGASFFYEFSHLDTACFEKFLELFSQIYPNEIHIIQLDNGQGKSISNPIDKRRVGQSSYNHYSTSLLS